MRKFLKLSATALALGCAAPVMAQDDGAAAGMNQFAEMMGGLFQAEPLTAEQEGRLPEAQAVVEEMMPDGFYAEMMGDMMEKMMRPMMSAFATPQFVLGVRLNIDEEAIAALSESEKAEAVRMLDPAFDRRTDAIVDVMTGKMSGIFAMMEDPMREGLSKAYAVRFDEAELADIESFFATPTGGKYASQSMAIFMDPQVMQASMQALPAMMSSFGDMESAMTQAMEALPKERAYADLSSAERDRLAELLGIEAAELVDAINPPKNPATD